MQSIPSVNGVDVAMDGLVVQTVGEAAPQCVGNNQRAIRAWLRQLPEGSVVAMESTGVHHQLLARLAHAAGMRVYVLNARNVYFYARGLGVRGKTDKADAAVIARYVAEHQQKLYQWQPAPAELTRIDELLRRRAVVVAKRDSLRQSLRGCKDLKAALAQLDRAFDSFLRVLEGKVKDLVRADEKLSSAQRRLASVIGFGPLGSTLLAVLLARIPFANSDALVAYSGWDPRPADSGRKQGRRKLSKAGPAYLRKQWFMAGLTAARTKALKPLYLALLAKGFTPTEAMVVLGRKLLRAAFAVWKTDCRFELSKFLPRPVTC